MIIDFNLIIRINQVQLVIVLNISLALIKKSSLYTNSTYCSFSLNLSTFPSFSNFYFSAFLSNDNTKLFISLTNVALPVANYPYFY